MTEAMGVLLTGVWAAGVVWLFYYAFRSAGSSEASPGEYGIMFVVSVIDVHGVRHMRITELVNWVKTRQEILADLKARNITPYRSTLYEITRITTRPIVSKEVQP